MSASATQPKQIRTPAEERPPQGVRCAACGAQLAADQEWCLECGAARTKIQAPPDWRIPVAVIVVLLVLVLAALVFALIELSIDANRSAAVTGAKLAAIAAPGA